MSHDVYKLSEVVGTSTEGTDAAIRTALTRAHKSLRNVRWFEVIETRGMISESGEIEFQVTLKVAFALEA